MNVFMAVLIGAQCLVQNVELTGHRKHP